MKKSLFILCFLLLGISVYAQAKKQVKPAFVYNNDVVYQGPFKSTQLFNRYERTQIWLTSKRLPSIEKVTCREAHLSLQNKGIWIGNLADDGKCLDPGEAPEWATGNYLNFLGTKNTSSTQLPGKTE